MLEQWRSNVVLICDRAVCRVLIAYFQGIEIERLPYIDVSSGVLELSRRHDGFAVDHLPVSSGAATRAAGPGTVSAEQLNMLAEEEAVPEVVP